MKTLDRVRALAYERDLSLFELARQCDMSYSTLRNAQNRKSQLTVETIEHICKGLNITMSEFFAPWE